MSTEATGWVIAGALTLFVLTMMTVLWFQGGLIARDERPLPSVVVGPQRPLGRCAAPTTRLSIGQAHREMQLHRDHLAADCPRKAAAFRVLVEERRVTPDSGRTT
ncbi:hypothetical protein [Nocardia macrotermitis]|uniref:Uncharacterized protein n=1 Tax=Nocardia macrotermitis TaxID=2585198 RepID=A0A7K0DBU5_9NOCA|nr:hypothetical protein [Nocardia macrotermitis]MQY23001.1 hypothetical protein [Nocardia macrotermitis]